ncbi:hypothetical protein Lepto7376_1542 [[Leptolyngbya] sp. PCC 7376]|uniref:hypothetical protein n=1 Tax=[Leptolyngbya] sp. PCC 7376 TaxID=111781 RepID=UPI00029EFF30|nr:hypothetical protein [[Leptolyngbya] sp. PCC 7376]AFY37885.1 hypothetical protein Lepto7376_1542 [[Leptolyngbya] sp. PCC 7376]
MKVAFVIPLKSEEVSKDWNVTIALLLRCLESIFNQSSNSFDVYLSCNSFPYISSSEKLHIIEHDYPIPTTWDDGHKDKYQKIYRALIEVQKNAPCYVMKLDADDLLHQNLVQFVTTDGKEGYYIENGYTYVDGKKWIQKLPQFHNLCGSSNLIRVTPQELPYSMNKKGKKFDIMLCGHNIFEEFYRSKGKDIARIPFRAGIYISGSGENHSGHDLQNIKSRRKWMSSFVKRQLLTKKIRRDFSLFPLSDYLTLIQQGKNPRSLPLRLKA